MKIKRNTEVNTPLLLIVFMLAVLVAAITVDMVNPVLSLIGEDLDASAAQVSWVVSGVSLVLAIGVPLYGRISDYFELRKLFTFAILIFAVGSIICALASNLPLLVFGRMVQGAGSAAIPVLSIVAISQVFPEGKRGGALGLIAGCIGIGTAAGPIFGGVVGQFFGWHALFWVTFLLAVIIVIGALLMIPDIPPTMDPPSNRQFDLLGGVLLGLTVGLFLFGITQGEAAGIVSFSSLGSLIGSLFALIGFIWRTTTAEHPFVPPALFSNKPYVSSVLVGLFTMFAYFSVLVFVPLMVVEVNGLSPGLAAMTLLPGGLAVAIFSPLAGRISDRLGAKPPIIGGLTLMGVSTLFLSTFASGASPFLVAAGVLGVCIGQAFTNSPANNAAASALKNQQVGIGLGIFQGSLFLGAGTGAGMMGVFLSARKEAMDPINPLYVLAAFPYSDVFLAVTVVVICALVCSFWLRR